MAIPCGYQQLSLFMVEQKYGLFREFRKLAYEDLLYRQSELVHLERDLRLIVQHDRTHGRNDEEKLHSLDWRRLSTSENRGSPSKHWAKRLEARNKLRDYRMLRSLPALLLDQADWKADETLLRYRQVFAQPQPKENEVKLLREWIARPDLGGGCGFIGHDLGPESPTVYDAEFQEDLMVIVDRGGEDDGLTKLLTGPVFSVFDWIVRRFTVSGDILEVLKFG
jgi:hypothetical protein